MQYLTLHFDYGVVEAVHPNTPTPPLSPLSGAYGPHPEGGPTGGGIEDGDGASHGSPRPIFNETRLGKVKRGLSN